MSHIKYHTDIEQGSIEWHKLKGGLLSASEIHNICNPKGIGKIGETYIMKKVGELISGSYDEIHGRPLEHGTYYEPFARRATEANYNCEIQEFGAVTNTKYKRCVVSPDGVDFENNIDFEFKCPFTLTNHVKFMLVKDMKDLKKVAKEYYWQILMVMLITEKERCRFISYHPDFPETFMLYGNVIIEWNDSEMSFLIDRISQANEIYDSMLKEICTNTGNIKLLKTLLAA